MTYLGQRPELPSLSHHFLLVRASNQAWFDIAGMESSLPSPFLWQPCMCYGKNQNKNGLERHERIFWHGASFTRAETTSCLRTPKILSTDATLYLGPILLHDQNWECPALKSSTRCQTFGVPCRWFNAYKWYFLTLRRSRFVVRLDSQNRVAWRVQNYSVFKHSI